MSTNGIQLWTVPATGSYTISCAGARAGGGGSFTGGYGRIVSGTFILTKGDILKILVGQMGATYMAAPGYTINTAGTGGGGTFVTTFDNTILLIGGGGGGGKNNPTWGGSAVGLDAPQSTSGNGSLGGGTNGGGGTSTIDNGGDAGGGGGGYSGNGSGTTKARGIAFLNNGLGGKSFTETVTFDTGGGGFGGGGGTFSNAAVVPGGGGGYSGGSASEVVADNSSAGGGGSYLGTAKSASSTSYGGTNTTNGYVTITPNFTITGPTTTTTSTTSSLITTSTSAISFNSSVIPYTAPATPLLTYTDSAAAFSTQVGSVATNSQYNRAVVGGSGVQFVAGGRGGSGGGIAVSNDGQNWSAAASGAATVFQTPTNIAVYSTAAGSGGFDASFGTVALTQRLTTPATYPSGDFRGISLSKTGQYQTAVINGGNIWTSSDYGVNWTERTTGATRIWCSISVSSTGQYQSAGANGGNIWTSSDYGVTWTSRATAFSWISISLSSTGQYQTAGVNQGNIWTSSDYGVNWTSRATPLNWYSLSVSSTGQYQTAPDYTGDIWISSDYGVSWTKRTIGTTKLWLGVSLSSTAQYQTTVVNSGNIWTSIDYGVNWIERTTGATRSWHSVSISSTGQYQTAVVNAGNIWTSSDFGVTWTERTTGATRNWRSVSLSSTGQYQTVVSSSFLFTSTDFGVTWVQRSTATKTNAFTRIKSSASGQYQLATSGPVGNLNGQLYVSSDYGQTWMPRRGLASWLGGAVSATGAVMMGMTTPTAATAALLRSTDFGNTFTDIPNTALTGSAYWRAIATTNSAATQTALAYGSTIYRSFDTGATWNSTAAVDIVGILTTEFSSAVSPTYAWKSLAMSADAKYQTGVLGGTSITGQIYVNSNYGRDPWTAVDSARNWASVAMSADGKYQSAVVTSGAIYYNSNFGAGTWTAVSSPAPGFPWTGIAVSSADGKYQTAVASGATSIYVNSNYGVGAWTAKAEALNWFGVAVSSTGRYQTAINRGGFIFIDASFGEATSWTQVDSQRAWVSVAMSGSGQYQTAVVAGGKIYVNNNYGANGAWTETDSNRAWISVAISGTTGRYQTAVVQNGQIYTNSTFGMGAWIPVDSSRNWVSVTISAEGKYQSAAVATSGQVYFSRDYGATWSTTAGLDIMGNRWQDVAVAAETGATQVTCVSGGYIYYSGDTGATWLSSIVSIDGVSPQTTNRVWQAVALSANGQYGLACVNSTSASGFLYRSLNYGASWSSSNISIDGVGTQTTNRPWQDVGMSANGKYQVACLNSNSQTAYTSNIPTAVGIMVPPPGAVATTFGSSWTQRGQDIDGEAVGDQSGYSVSLSADGTVVAIGAPINYGANGRESGQVRVYALNAGVWTKRGQDIDGDAGLSSLPMVVSATGTSGSRNWWDVSISSTGQYQSACAYNGGLYISSNYGVSWSLVPSGNGAPTSVAWYRISISSTGQYQIAGVYSSGLYISSNYGVSWSLVPSGNGVPTNANWFCMSLSSTGQYQTAGADGGGIYTSSNFGSNWALVPSGNGAPTSAGWYNVSISSTGQYQTAVVNGGGIYVSSNFGSNWGLVPSGNGPPTNVNWYGNSVSSNGQYQSACVYNGGIYTSSNFGANWTLVPAVNGAPISVTWHSISISSTGQYQSAVVLDGAASNIYISSNFGVNWKTSHTAGDRRSISVSSTGQYQTAGGYGGLINFSRDYGFTWDSTAKYEITTGDQSGFSVSLSANGNTVAVGAPYYDLSGVIDRGQVRVYDFSTNSLWVPRGSNIMVGEGSNDYSGMSMSMSEDGKVVAIGAPFNDGSGNLTDSGHVRVYAWDGSAWAQRGADIDGEFGLTAANIDTFWPGVSISSTGQYQTAVGNKGIYISSNYGVNWSVVSAANGVPTTATWYSVSLSSSGQYQSAISQSEGGANTQNIYVSSNFGITWTARKNFPLAYANSISVSSTGQYQSANAENETIWRSTDYGITWTPAETVRNWQGIALSSTGQYQTAVHDGGKIYISTNYGENWVDLSANGAPTSGGWYSVTISATAQYQTACISAAGSIYISSNFGANWSVVPAANGIPINHNWKAVSMSSTGQYQTAIAAQMTGTTPGIYISSNFGVNWTLVPVANGIPANINWQYISISATGQYLCAPSNNVLYFSRDYGLTWSNTAKYEITGGDQSGYSVSLSADGSVVAVGAPLNDGSGNIIDCGQVRVYSWSGSAWARRGAVDIDGKATNDKSGYSVSMSADGTVMAIGAPFSDGSGNAIDSGHVRVYGWNGIDWIKRGDDIEGVVSATGTSGSRNWYSISISSTGQYQSTVVDGGGIYISSNYGVTWTLVPSSSGPPTNGSWVSISLSLNGQYQSTVTRDVSGNIYTSADYGISWTKRTQFTGFWYSISVSGTGQYQSAVINSDGVGGNIWTSSDYGVNWTERIAGGSTRGWVSLSLSSIGQYQTAVAKNASIWTSSDFGLTWINRTGYPGGSKPWRSVSLSSSGQYQTVVIEGGYIWFSSDFGINWTERIVGETTRNWYSGSLSSTGQYQTACINNGYIYTSSDFGVTWTPRMSDVNRNWYAVSVSSTGQYQSATVSTGLIYFSRDYGFTWKSTAEYEVVTGGDQSGFSVSLSANGNTVAVGAPYNDVDASGGDRGHVRVYDWNAGTSKWNQRGVMDIDGEAYADLAGWSVSLSADGSTVAFGAPMNDGSGNLLPNSGSVRVYNVAVANQVTYTSSNSSVADICGNLLIIKGAAGSTNIAATQGGTTTNGVLTVSGATYTLVYTLGTASTTSFIYYSKDYGASWTSLSAAGSRSWSSVALSENGGTISATTNDATGAIFTYTMPDDQYYRPPALLNSGSATTASTVRAITYGNSGTGAATDGYWVAGADASANTLAYSSNGVDWTAVAGSKTTLFNSVNGVAYGADLWGTMMWVAVGAPFVGSVPGSTAYSIAYSYNMTTWTGVRNLANFTGQGNHVAYGQDEYGTGMWVAVGQGDGVLAANLGDSSFGNSNGGSTGGGTPSTTVFYSYDGANWAAGTGVGIFAVSGTDVAWGVDASGVATWVATGVGFTDPLTGVVIAGGQIAHSTNGRVWTPIRAPQAIVPAQTPTIIPATSRVNVTPPPPASTGFVVSTFGTTWAQLGLDILGTQAGEQSGWSVALSADGTTVAIGSYLYNVTGTNSEGRTRIYKYNGATWGQLGLDISGTQVAEYSGHSVALSADGTTVAIGSWSYDVTGTNSEGRTRIYKYNKNGTLSWDLLGSEILGTQVKEQSGRSVALSADGMTVAIGSYLYDKAGLTTNADTDEGRVRVYKLIGTTWTLLGVPSDILGTQVDEQSGYSVSLSADGMTVAIGSRYYDKAGLTTNADTDEGRVRVYKLIGTTWTLLGVPSDILGTQASEYNGWSVALSADGTVVAIGSRYYDVPAQNAGRTRIYKLIGTTWTLLGSEILGTQPDEQNGYSVSLSADGTIVAIGSFSYNKAGGTTDNSTDEGQVRIYKLIGTTWTLLGSEILGTQVSEYSGYSVSLSADGTTVAIGSHYYDKAGGPTNTSTTEGRVRIYKLDVTGAFFSSSNPAVADICGNGLLIIKDISAGTTTITATQPAYPPFSLTPVTVQGTLTVTGTVYTLVYHTVFSTLTPFSTSALTVAYGRAGSQGTGVPLWMVGGSGGNVFATSSRPSVTDAGIWSVVSAAAPVANAPFPVCNSIGYSNGIWVAANNTDATNILARSIDGGSTWTPVPLSSVSGIIAGSASVGSNAFCNYSLAYADFSNDTNLRSWVAIPGTKNFMFEGGVNTVASVSSNIVASAYGIPSITTPTIPTTVSVMVAPPGVVATTYGTWGKMPTGDIPGEVAEERSGYSVSMSADGTRVVVGAYSNTGGGLSFRGMTRIYQWNGSAWSKMPTGDIPGEVASEQSGWSVSMSADGRRVVVGANGNTGGGLTNRGMTRIYQWNGSAWSKMPTGDIPGEVVAEQSGYSVSMSADGTRVAVGAFNNSGGGLNSRGMTRIYQWNGSAWSKMPTGDIPGEVEIEQSGYSVSMSADGTRVAVGAQNISRGMTRIYQWNGSTWSKMPTGDIPGEVAGEQSGSSVSMSADGTRVAVGANGNTSFRGITRIYQWNGSAWSKMTNGDIPGEVAGEASGTSVSMSADGTQVVVGAYSNTGGGLSSRGMTRIYQFNGSTWLKMTGGEILGEVAEEQSGRSVSMSADGTRVAVGAAQNTGGGLNYRGMTRVYKIPTTNQVTYTSSNSSVADIYGNLLLIKGTNGTSNIVATQGATTITGILTVAGTIYTLVYVTLGTRAWWVAGGAGTSAAGVSGAVLAYSTDPSGATGWTKSASPAIASLATINDVAFSPQTQRWLAVGAGASGSSTQNVLFSDASGATWTASAVATPVFPVITLNTCIWNQLDASASEAGRWLAGGTRNDISTSASLYISTDVSGEASPWTPIAGTGAILSQVYSLAYNGRVWIAAGVPASDVGSTSTLMRTTDPTGATGWQGIATTNASISGFDTAARSIAWNADQQMWVATGENTGTAADASFSSVIYSLDVTGSTGTWRTVRESNSSCFSGQGNGIAFTGRKWLAVGEGTNQIVATTDISANAVFGTGAGAAAPTWSAAGNANATLPVRGSDIAFTGRNLIATGSGVVISTDPAGTSWSAVGSAAGFTDASGGGTSITFEPTFDGGTGRLVATGKSAANSISVSSDNGATWNTSSTAVATAVQFSSRQQTVATTQTLFTTGGNSVAYVGNDTLFGGGGNDVHWSGKRWIATGKNSGADGSATTASAATVPDITNNNTAPIAVSDDGITWQCVSSSQAPNITEGMFVATNSRIGAMPLIDSRITIMDGGDTETTVDYGGGGVGAGIAQLDIIAELPVTSVSASNTTGAVGVIGVGANNSTNSVNGVGVTPPVSFDNTAFTITTRPV
jgi:hypothetical protein